MVQHPEYYQRHHNTTNVIAPLFSRYRQCEQPYPVTALAAQTRRPYISPRKSLPIATTSLHSFCPSSHPEKKPTEDAEQHSHNIMCICQNFQYHKSSSLLFRKFIDAFYSFTFTKSCSMAGSTFSIRSAVRIRRLEVLMQGWHPKYSLSSTSSSISSFT